MGSETNDFSGLGPIQRLEGLESVIEGCFIVLCGIHSHVALLLREIPFAQSKVVGLVGFDRKILSQLLVLHQFVCQVVVSPGWLCLSCGRLRLHPQLEAIGFAFVVVFGFPAAAAKAIAAKTMEARPANTGRDAAEATSAAAVSAAAAA